MKKLLLVMTPVLFLFSCAKEKGEVLIRVNNTSPLDLKNVIVYSFDGNSQEIGHSYGNIGQGSVTSYISHENVFSVPLFKFNVPGGTSFDLQGLPCPTGVGYLTSGRYSLYIWADTSGNVSSYYSKD